jgi:hypothetical protein
LRKLAAQKEEDARQFPPIIRSENRLEIAPLKLLKARLFNFKKFSREIKALTQRARDTRVVGKQRKLMENSSGVCRSVRSVPSSTSRNYLKFIHR